MAITTEVPLDTNLVESLQEVTAEQGVTIETVLDNLIRDYLRQVRQDKLEQEQHHFEAMHVELKQNYLGQHVAIYKGQLIDHDSDVVMLVRRIRQRLGRLPVLIVQVEEKPVPEYMIRSPRLVHAE